MKYTMSLQICRKLKTNEVITKIKYNYIQPWYQRYIWSWNCVWCFLKYGFDYICKSHQVVNSLKIQTLIFGQKMRLWYSVFEFMSNRLAEKRTNFFGIPSSSKPIILQRSRLSIRIVLHSSSHLLLAGSSPSTLLPCFGQTLRFTVLLHPDIHRYSLCWHFAPLSAPSSL